MKINGTDYALYTTENSLPTFFAPATLGTTGQILSCTSTGLAWINQTVNTDIKYYRVLLKKSANDTDETTFVNFASTLTYNPSTKYLKINSQK